jgi:GDP/UDP-N,N'-diacetylbacillosamine 2-epimerase (hydrolysing)
MKNKIKIAVFSTTRSDFGLLSSFLHALKASQVLHPLLFVGGTHLSKNHGQTISEVEEFGFEIAGKFDYLHDGDDRDCLSLGFADAISCIAGIFKDHQFDYACVLGDRYEILSIVINAILYNKPIIHINGGEVTEGAIDEVVRSMTTKAAHLHFVSCENYADNIKRMGEEEWRIHNTGTLSADSMRLAPRTAKGDLFRDIGLDIEKKTILMTYHPVTQETTISHEEQISNLFRAINNYDFQTVITSPNADHQRDIIQSAINRETSANRNMVLVQSLGVKRYYDLIPHCEFVIGNSSSGIVEVPFFSVPTINIGNRQRGRLRHPSVIDVDYSASSIDIGIQKALSKDFSESLKNMEYKFGDGRSAERMVKIIEETKLDQKLMLKQGAVSIS